MQTDLYTPETLVSAIKRQARRISKTQSVPQHEALDLAAQARGYLHWHHAHLCAKASRIQEADWRSSVVYALAPQDAAKAARLGFVADAPLARMAEHAYRQDPDPYEYAADELHALRQLVYGRLSDSNLTDPAQVRDALQARFGIAPLYCWISGQRYGLARPDAAALHAA